MTQLLEKKGHNQCTKPPILGDLGEVMISNLTPIYWRGWFLELNPQPVAFGGRHLPSHQSSTSRWHNCYLQKKIYCSLLSVEKKSGTLTNYNRKLKIQGNGNVDSPTHVQSELSSTCWLFLSTWDKAAPHSKQNYTSVVQTLLFFSR